MGLLESMNGQTMIQKLSEIEKKRYARNLLVPEIGQKGQLSLKNSSVIIIGAGGLGTASSLYLAAAGVGKIGILDSDLVELSNLQRQVIHNTSTVGLPKVESAKRKLDDLNPLVKIISYHLRISGNNAPGVIKDYDIVIDATDNFKTRYLLNHFCVELNKPFIFGAVYQFSGQMSVFDASKGPCFRCVFKNRPDVEQPDKNKEIGIVGAVPGTIGTLQAVEALKLILKKGNPSVGRLILYDGLEMSFQEILVSKDPDCIDCGNHEGRGED